MSGHTWVEIRDREDVTDTHVEEAADCREGLYGGVPLTWDEVISRVEGRNEDWGSSMDSPAIRELQRRTRLLLKERGG